MEIHLPGVGSLKQKRRIVKSIVDRLRSRLNVSAAEMGLNDQWQRATLGLASISNSKAVLSRTFESARKLVENQGEVYLTQFETEYL